MSSVRENLLQNNPDTVSYIRKLYNLDDTKRMEESIIIIEDWIKKQNHFLKKEFPREYLEAHVVNNKGSMEKVKFKLDKICKMKTVLPQFYTIINVKDMVDRGAFKCVRFMPLPKMTKNHERIFLLQIEPNEFFHKIPFMLFYNLMMIIVEYMLRFDYFDGCKLIIDYRKINPLDMIPKLNPLELKQLFAIAIDGYGMRLKGIHYITESNSIHTLLKIILPFFPPKLSKRIHIHKKVEELYEFIPKEILPIEFGGSERSQDDIQNDWIKLLSSEESLQYLQWAMKAGVNESYRINDETYDEYLGLAGSFRTLNVD